MERLGSILEHFGRVLECLERLGASWSVLEPSLSRLGAVLERLEAVCGALSDSGAPTTRQQLSGPSRQGGGRGRVNLPLGLVD